VRVRVYVRVYVYVCVCVCHSIVVVLLNVCDVRRVILSYLVCVQCCSVGEEMGSVGEEMGSVCVIVSATMFCVL